ncbi:hypothetical protein [Ulvibacter litoralis]|uniref:MetA-pathway of phenol degradation n=1 Tax=Ulvibacter litoralis TaxID=227084 RepID=A0A1G7DIT5_9FLAO|nr:hypothetical protein [Ulvibacter litoralis]SDE50960.1 hypothetical protein SAMN05421855_101985 [Ulvibacter litoralis]
MKKNTRVRLSQVTKLLVLTAFFLIQSQFSFSQQHIVITPGFMGPNALPVPEIKTGILPSQLNLKVAFENHSSDGDQTSNFYTELYVPLQAKKVGLFVSVVPIEFYNVDEATLLDRKIETTDGKGTAGGDIYVGTYIQLLQNHKSLPDLLLTINLRTASGTKLEEARYTDSPGYFFDLSAGKEIALGSSFLPSMRLYAMGGLYVYQTHRTDFRQNDAILYGAGIDLNFNHFVFKNAFGGYSGFVRDGDRPALVRSTLKTTFNSMVNYELGFQKGIADQKYTTVRFGLNFDLSYFKSLVTNSK